MLINQEYELVPLGELKPHPNNPRKGSVSTIKTSIDSNGFYGAIVAQKGTNYILAGNHRYKAAREAGLSEVPVIWIEVDDLRAKKILLADNRANDLASYDSKELSNILAELSNLDDLTGSLYSESDLDELIKGTFFDPPKGKDDTEKDPNYSRKIEAPIYEPKEEEKPLLDTLLDTSKYEELLREIDKSKLSDKEKEFLRLAATRHIVFDYGTIAEYYSHSNKDSQELFENSALVIIDFDKAIEKGFVKLVGAFGSAYDKDLADREETEDED